MFLLVKVSCLVNHWLLEYEIGVLNMLIHKELILIGVKQYRFLVGTSMYAVKVIQLQDITLVCFMYALCLCTYSNIYKRRSCTLDTILSRVQLQR